MTDQTVKVWITRYALSAGIQVAQARISQNDPDLATVRGHYDNEFYRKPDWHTSFHGALARAEYIKAREIESLRKALAKMEKMTFEDAG